MFDTFHQSINRFQRSCMHYLYMGRNTMDYWRCHENAEHRGIIGICVGWWRVNLRNSWRIPNLETLAGILNFRSFWWSWRKIHWSTQWQGKVGKELSFFIQRRLPSCPCPNWGAKYWVNIEDCYKNCFCSTDTYIHTMRLTSDRSYRFCVESFFIFRQRE